MIPSLKCKEETDMKLHINFKGNRESVKSAETNTAGKNWDLNLDLEFEPDEIVAASKLCKDAITASFPTFYLSWRQITNSNSKRCVISMSSCITSIVKSIRSKILMLFRKRAVERRFVFSHNTIFIFFNFDN